MDKKPFKYLTVYIDRDGHYKTKLTKLGMSGCDFGSGKQWAAIPLKKIKNKLFKNSIGYWDNE
jgi:hypothetical protein